MRGSAEGSSVADFPELMARLDREDEMTKFLAGPPRAGEPDDLLLRAKLHLERDIGFGLLERFDESVLRFKRELGWGHVLYRKINANPERPETITKAQRARLRSVMELDLELYAWARDRFDEQLRQAPFSASELRRFHNLNRGYGTVMNTLGLARRKLGLPSRPWIPKLKRRVRLLRKQV
jgi:hypothetical protein